MSVGMLELIPLGGLGEFGMNLMVYRDGRDALIVDAGMMFPSDDQHGVDVLIPDLSFLEDCGTLHGVVVSHGHEDHIGALPYLLARYDVPVYGPPHALALIQARLREHPDASGARLAPLPADGEPLVLGPFTVTALPATHTIPQSKMIALETRQGLVLHTADFKLDAAGAGEPGTDLEALARLGRRGVLALCCDSTNAERQGSTPGEQIATRALGQVLDESKGRVLVTTFSSNVRRLETVAALAGRRGRRVALVGSSIRNQVEHAERLGIVRFAPGCRMTPEQAMTVNPARAVLLTTGTQGEPLSALARLATGTHPDLSIVAGDRVVLSSRVIPGNEKRIGRMIDRLLERGAEVTTTADAPVHVSGHGSQDDLVRVLELLRPRYLIPIHGEYRQMWALARLAARRGMPTDRIVLARSGDRIGVSESEIVRLDPVQSGTVCVDERRMRVPSAVLRDRRRGSAGGVVVPVLVLGGGDRRLLDPPRILTRGLVVDGGGAVGLGRLLPDAQAQIARSVRQADLAERTDTERLADRVGTDLRRFLRRRLGRRPLIIPVIVDGAGGTPES